MERNMGVKPDFKISECTKDGVYINIEHIFHKELFFLKRGNIKLFVYVYNT